MAETTDGTLISQQLTEVTENLVAANNEKNAILRTLAEYGAGVSEGDPMAEINPALQDLLASLQKGEATTTVTFVVNPTGGNGYIPEDASVLAAACEGAYIQIEEIGTTNTWRVPINNLGPNAAFAFDNTFTKGATRIRARIVCGASGEAIMGRWQTAIIVNREAVTITLETYLSDEQTLEIGRVFPISATDKDSFPIVATTARGVRTELFGRYAANGEWVNETGFQNAIPEIDRATGEVASWALGAEGRNDISNAWPWRAARRVDFKVRDAAGVETTMAMAGFDRADFYGVRIEEREMVFSTLAEDGTETSVTKPCRILWIARPTMPGYHIPSCAYIKRRVENEAGQSSIEMELLDGLYTAAHKANSFTAKVIDAETGATVSITCINSGTLGKTNDGLSVQAFTDRAYALNRLTFTDTRDALAPVELPPDATNRRFACSNVDTYMYFWPLFIVQFGLDSQAAITGVSSDSVPQTKAGETDAILKAGFHTGVLNSAAGYNPFLFLGIENFGYGSEGEALADLSWFSGRDSDGAAYETQAYVQPDRAAYMPMVNDRALLTDTHGYLHAATRDSGNNITHLSGFNDNAAVADIHLPCRADNGFLNAKGCDNTEIYRSGQGTNAWALSNATVSRYRAAGAGLGACALGWTYGNVGPGNAGAVNFGARVTLALTARGA